MTISIGLATVTNKVNSLLVQNLPYMVGEGVSECLVINHCSESEKDTPISFNPQNYGPTRVSIENFSGKFHEARNYSFDKLAVDAKVVWNDDHVFSEDDGSLKFQQRISESVERYGYGNHIFIMPTFAIHPRLLTKAKPFTGISGDAAVCVGPRSGILFSEDDKYADRQKHICGVTSFMGACGVLHLDQLKPLEFLAYRGLLNSTMRNFNLDNQSMETAWESRTGQPIGDTVRRLVLKMNSQPENYFLRAPDSYVEQLPKHLRDVASLSIREFREHMFGEVLDFTFNVEDVAMFEEQEYVSSSWTYSDF
jgi:hypothetical protein